MGLRLIAILLAGAAVLVNVGAVLVGAPDSARAGGASSTQKQAAMHAPETTTESLYERIGGYDAIAGVTDAFIGRLASDPDLGRFLTGLSTGSKARLRQLVVDQICALTGGPCIYIGRDMKSAHAGLGITESDWQRSEAHFVATLESFSVPDREREELIAAFAAMKPDIVEPATPQRASAK